VKEDDGVSGASVARRDFDGSVMRDFVTSRSIHRASNTAAWSSSSTPYSVSDRDSTSRWNSPTGSRLGAEAVVQHEDLHRAFFFELFQPKLLLPRDLLRAHKKCSGAETGMRSNSTGVSDATASPIWKSPGLT
jgi:hypothetical protein